MEFDSFARWLCHNGWRQTYVGEIPVIFGQNWPTQQLHGLFATAKLLIFADMFLNILVLWYSIAYIT